MQFGILWMVTVGFSKATGRTNYKESKGNTTIGGAFYKIGSKTVIDSINFTPEKKNGQTEKSRFRNGKWKAFNCATRTIN